MTIDPNAFTFDDDWYREGVEFEAKANFDIQIGGKAPPSQPSFDPARLGRVLKPFGRMEIVQQY